MLNWEAKADLPFDIYSAESVPYNNSILVFGGRSNNLNDNKALDTIYYYDPETDEWLLKGHMKNERYYFPAFLVPDSYANCSN